jgi:cyclohexyl-isocyanide hydratase
VCTGAFILGAAGLLKGRKATTNWTAIHLLPYFGAVPTDERYVVDGTVITTAGVTAGIDGALRAASILCGDEAAQVIQLMIQYAPEPSFNSGDPKTAPSAVLEKARNPVHAITEQRQRTAERAARRLQVALLFARTQ